MILIRGIFIEVCMLKNRMMVFILICLLVDVLHATTCDVSGFKQECDIPVQPRPIKHFHAYAFCTGSYGYLTPAQFDQLARYHRRDVNIVLKVDGELVDVRCLAGRRSDLSEEYYFAYHM